MVALQLNSSTKYLLLLSCCGRTEHRTGLGGFILSSLISEITTVLHESPGYPNYNITWTSFTKISRILGWNVTPWHTPFYLYHPEHQMNFRAIKQHLTLEPIFFSKLHLFYIYFWAEHHLSPPSKPTSQDRSKLTQILIKLQIIREQSWHPKHSNQPRTSVVYSESEREGGNLKRKPPGTWALRRKAIVWNRLEQGSLCQTPLPGTPRNLPHPVKVGSVSELFLGKPFPG